MTRAGDNAFARARRDLRSPGNQLFRGGLAGLADEYRRYIFFYPNSARWAAQIDTRKRPRALSRKTRVRLYLVPRRALGRGGVLDRTSWLSKRAGFEEARRDGTPRPPVARKRFLSVCRRLRLDHRRNSARIARLRAKLKYARGLFVALAPGFTLDRTRTANARWKSDLRALAQAEFQSLGERRARLGS